MDVLNLIQEYAPPTNLKSMVFLFSLKPTEHQLGMRGHYNVCDQVKEATFLFIYAIYMGHFEVYFI